APMIVTVQSFGSMLNSFPQHSRFTRSRRARCRRRRPAAPPSVPETGSSHRLARIRVGSAVRRSTPTSLPRLTDVERRRTMAPVRLQRLRGGHMLNPGDKAPDFSGKDHLGNTVKLSDFKGKTLVLWFYPKADTPG